MLRKFLISFFFIINVCSNIFAVDVAICNKQPELVTTLIPYFKNIRNQCIEDIYLKEKIKVDKETNALNEIQEKLKVDLIKNAYRYEVTIIMCDSPDHSWPKQKVNECNRINKERNVIIDRIRKLNGWDNNFKEKIANNGETDSLGAKEIEAPCPTQEELNQIQALYAILTKASTRPGKDA